MDQVKKVLSPVCGLVGTNKQMLSLVLVGVVLVSMLPVDKLLGTNLKANLVSNFKGQMAMVVSVVVALLFLCLYLNNDVMNLVLLLYVCAIPPSFSIFR